jgi:hypothetical protein
VAPGRSSERRDEARSFGSSNGAGLRAELDAEEGGRDDALTASRAQHWRVAARAAGGTCSSDEPGESRGRQRQLPAGSTVAPVHELDGGGVAGVTAFGPGSEAVRPWPA